MKLSGIINIKSFIFGFSLFLGGVFAVSITNINIWTTTATNGDIINADAWNELVNKSKPCTSLGQFNCYIKGNSTSTSSWSCNSGYGFSGATNQCEKLPLAVCAMNSSSCSATDAKSCKWLKDNYGATTDGVYWIDPDASIGAVYSPVKVYCDMTKDGGGWTMIVGISGTSSNHKQSAASTWTDYSDTGYGKLSDAYINALRETDGSGYSLFRFKCGTVTSFIKDNVWNASVGATNHTIYYSSTYNGTFTSGVGQFGTAVIQWWLVSLVGINYGYNGVNDYGCYQVDRSKNGNVYVK